MVKHFWEGLRGVAFSEEVSLRAGFEVSKVFCHYQNVFPPSFPPTPPPFSLCLMPVDQYGISIYATMSLLYHRGLRASGTLSTMKFFLLCIVLVTVFCYSNRNIIKTEVGIEEWATSETNLTRLFFGEMWKNLVFWTRLETVNGA